MALQVRCPNAHVLKIDEKHFGKKIRCPKCQAVMQVATPTASAPSPAFPPLPRDVNAVASEDNPEFKTVDDGLTEFDDFLPDDQPAPKKKGGMKKSERMKLARIGLTCHYAKVVLNLLGILCMIVAPLLAGIGFGTSGDTLAALFMILVILAVGFFLIAPLLGLAGSILCLWVPKKTRAKPLIIASFVLDISAIIVFVVFQILNIGSAAVGPRRGSSEMGLMVLTGTIMSGVMVFGAYLLFIAFLRALMNYFRDRNGADEAFRVLLWSIGLAVGSPIYFIGSAMLCGLIARQINPWIGAFCLLLMMIAWIWTLIKLMMRLLMVITGLRNYMERWA